MKQTISIFLLVAVLLPSISKVWIMVDFKLNQDYIAKVLCINKNKPESTCNGKCHLKKQLKKTEEKEKKQIPGDLKEKVELVFLIEYTALIAFETPCTKQSVYIYNQKHYTSLCIHSIFHPPQLS